VDAKQPGGRYAFAQADVTGHGLLDKWHSGCRCPWCVSKARERGCLCPPCAALRASSPYFELPQGPPNPDRRRGATDNPRHRSVPPTPQRKALP
jgi:hypothetical protein